MFGDPIDNEKDWPFELLPNVTTIVLGSTPRTNNDAYWDGDIKWISPAELSDESFYVYDTVKHITEEGVKSAGLKSFPANTVLFSTRAPIGKTAIAGCEMYCNQGFKNFICGPRLNPVYLYYLLRHKKEHFQSLGSGTTFRELSRGAIEKIAIAVPDMELQDRFEKIFRQSDKSKFVRFKSQFIEMFYDKGYPVKSIGDVVDRKIARVAKVFSKTDEIQYLDISSIDNASKTVTGLTPYTLMDAPSRAQYVLAKDDIVYSTVRPNLQNIAINPYEEENVVGSTGFCVLRCTGVSTGYMWGVVNSTLFTDTMINKASGANYPAVTDKVVLAYEIPIPPEDQQLAYEHLVRQSDKSK